MTNNILDNPVLDQPVISPDSKYYKVKTGKIKSIATGNDQLLVAEPDSPAMSDSQYNQIIATPSGHIIEIDDTPNAERICVFHKSGHFVEMSNKGMVTKVFGKDHEIILDDKNLTVSGILNMTVNGDCNLLIGGNATTKIQGNEHRYIEGNSLTYVKGTIDVISEKTIQTEAFQNINTKSRGKTTFYAIGELDLSTKSALVLTSSILAHNGKDVGANHVHGGIYPGGSDTSPPVQGGPTAGAMPKSTVASFGLGFSTSLMEPSATELFLNKSDASSALYLRDSTVTYPKDRKKI